MNTSLEFLDSSLELYRLNGASVVSFNSGEISTGSRQYTLMKLERLNSFLIASYWRKDHRWNAAIYFNTSLESLNSFLEDLQT